MSAARPVIAVVTPWFPNPYEPVLGIFVAQQVEALRQVADVRLIHLQLNCELAGWKFKDRLQRRKRPYTPVTSIVPDIVINHPFRWTAKVLGEGGALSWLSKRLHRALRKLGKMDAVLGWVGWPTGCAVQRAGKALGVRAAVMECSGPFESVLRTETISRELHTLFTGSDAVLTVSPLMTRHIKAALGIEFHAKEVGCVIGDQFFSLPLERAATATTRILCVGAICRDKGQHLLIEAAAILKSRGREDFEITCAGYGPDLEAFRSLAQTTGVAHLVKFPGGVTEEEKLNLYASAHFFVTPTLHDTFGAVIAEAMAAGLPVVSTPCGAAEWIVDERCGILCAVNDSESLAQCLSEMIDQNVSFDRLVIRAKVRGLFGAESYAGRVVSGLQCVV